MNTVGIAWALYLFAGAIALRNAQRSVESHRGLRILIIGGPATVLAILSVIVTGAPMWIVIPVAALDFASWYFQKVGPWPFPDLRRWWRRRRGPDII